MSSILHPEYNHIFGPVPSRRLGISLGVDLLPHKTCSLNCVYCECGSTTHLTVKQKAWVPIDQVREELEDYLSRTPEIDCITFSGAGEPTLHSGIGDIIDFIKTDYPEYRVALITNSTLFSDSETRRRVVDADIILASVDSVSDDIFKQINRPHPNLELPAMLDGISALAREYRNRLWTEVFIVPGLNDGEGELEKIRQFLEQLSPEMIHINSLDRPGTEPSVTPLDQQSANKIHKVLSTAEPISVPSCKTVSQDDAADYKDRIVLTIRRRPCTAEDISRITGSGLSLVNRSLDFLVKNGEIERKVMPRGIFYVPRG